MRTSRLVTVLAGLLAVALPTLSMAVPASASDVGSRAVASAPKAATMGPPYVTALFNHPSVGGPQQGSDWKVIWRAENAIAADATDPNFTNDLLQLSMFRISDTGIAQFLVDDANAGVTVQVLLNGAAETDGCHHAAGCINPAFQVLEQLNTIDHQAGRSGTWLKTCAGYGPDHPTPLAGSGNGCLGQLLNHNKFMLASQDIVGGQMTETPIRDEVLQTSSNDTKNQYKDAFNNALIIANRPAIYHDYQRYFARLAAAYRSTRPTGRQRFTARTGTHIDEATLANHDLETQSYPQRAGNDPFLTALQSVSTAHRCANPSAEPTSPADTTISLGMFDIRGRSATLHELADLADAGCHVHIVYTAISRAAYRTLHQPRVRLQQLCTTQTTHHQSRYYIHSKYLLIAGTTHDLGRDRRILYTGSENLTSGSLTDADNRDIRYVESASDAPIYTAYHDNFQQMNSLGGHKTELGYGCGASDNG
jgi:phosphatidylserine/phosphatidylglycerophosphate/cardiolipin synthase-like enzyme